MKRGSAGAEQRLSFSAAVAGADPVICYVSPVPVTPTEQLTARLAALAARQPGLSLFVLHGSRARGEAHAASDWDFAYLARAGQSVDVEALVAELVPLVGSERVDLTDLSRAGGLLRFRVAREGILIFESPGDTFDRYCIAAASFWCDVEPVLRRAYDALLADL